MGFRVFMLQGSHLLSGLWGRCSIENGLGIGIFLGFRACFLKGCVQMLRVMA